MATVRGTPPSFSADFSRNKYNQKRGDSGKMITTAMAGA
jgi:hypothetical protein